MGRMATSIADLRARAKSPGGKKAIKYTMVSVISVAVSQVALVILYGLLHWTARSSNILAVTIGGVPAARMGDQCAHGGSIVLGFPTVMIGG